jgi:hypothetical protein
MGRVDSFREVRLVKLKIFLAMLLFIVLLVSGIIAADFSINSVVSDTPKVEIIKVAEVSCNLYTIDFANREYKLNTYYLCRDIERLKKRLSEIF